MLAKQQRLALAMTVMQLMTLCIPLVVLLLVLGLENSTDKIWLQPEWSFISFVFLVEFFRDIGEVALKQREAPEQIWMSYSASLVLVIFGIFFIIYDYHDYEGIGKIEHEKVLFLKFLWFTVCFMFFAYKRYQANSLAHVTIRATNDQVRAE